VKTDTLPMLSEHDWSLLQQHARPATYRRSDVILAEGASGRALHIVNNGTVRVEQAQNGRGIALALLGPGEIFGEMGFVENAPADASVVAEEDVTVDVIDGNALQSVMASEPGFAVRFYHSLALTLIRRLRVTSRRLTEAGSAGAGQAEISPFHGPRTGNISARQVPPALTGGLAEFERALAMVEQELRAGSLGEQDAAPRVKAACDAVVRLLDQFTQSESITKMGWSDLLAFRDASGLEAGVGDYVFRKTFATFMLSATMARCYAEPRGFPDDHETMAAIYANAADGDDRLGPLIDGWFLDRALARSRRASRDLMEARLLTMVRQQPAGTPVRIASLASGVAAELLSLCASPQAAAVSATCVDIDNQALQATARRAERADVSQHFTLIQGDVVVSAGESVALPPQHAIYALGLGEHLGDDQVVDLIDFAFDRLAPGGIFTITNLAATNPDRGLMAHVLGLKVNHRTADDLRGLLARSHFGAAPVDVAAEETGVTWFASASKAG
jgi:extracellular factor (EF) 3-hydroxypalmitic acid methyl ester biosynthesis protein